MTVPPVKNGRLEIEKVAWSIVDTNIFNKTESTFSKKNYDEQCIDHISVNS